MNTNPCSNPEFEKIKLGRSHIKSHKTSEHSDGGKELRYFKFLEIRLKNDQIKLTNKRTSMQLLEFFGAVGGMTRFVGSILGQLGGYFSAKFFGAKLMTDLYI